MAPPRLHARVAQLVGDELLRSPWFMRLGGVSFLGTLDAHPRSRRSSTRLEHSLGVAKLGCEAAAALELSEPRARLFVVACLLHDIGHYPLSHAAEPAFAKILGASHHEVGRWIVLGDGPISPARSLRPQLEALDVDPQQVWAIIDRPADIDPELRPLAELLKAPINLDTLEGIHRVARDFRLHRRAPPERIFTWVEGELGIARNALPAMDQFWLLKDRVYDRVINLPSNILAEARLCELVAGAIDRAVLDELDRFDDSALRERLGSERLDAVLLDGGDDGEYELWNSVAYGEMVADPSSASEGTREPIMVRTRKRYYVDRSVESERAGLRLRDWTRRFRHERKRGWLVARRQDQLSLPLAGLAPDPHSAVAELVSDAPEI